MSGLIDKLISKQEHHVNIKNRHPDGFEPGVQSPSYSASGKLVPGTIIAALDTGENDEVCWDDEFKGWGLDPNDWQILEPIEFRFWDMAIGNQQVRRMKYFKARFVQRKHLIDPQEVKDLIKYVRSRKRREPKLATLTSQPHSLVAPFGDTQLGKDDGDGLEGTVKRMVAMKELILDRYNDLKRAGYNITELVMPSLGDLIENCIGHYAQQKYRVQANLRYQISIGYNTIAEILMYLAPHIPHIRVPVVGGNHGEVRDSDGQSFTDFSDNMDVAILEIVDQVLHKTTDAYDHVVITTPHKDLTQTFMVQDKVVAIAHGHQFARGKGSSPADKAIEWWRGQQEGRSPVGEADLLITGHFHYYQATERSDHRWWFQIPALEGGSEWYEQKTGLHSEPGLLTFTISENGWGNKTILRGNNGH